MTRVSQANERVTRVSRDDERTPRGSRANERECHVEVERMNTNERMMWTALPGGLTAHLGG